MDLIKEKSVSDAIQYRRSVRVFKKSLDNEKKVKECIRLATLSLLQAVYATLVLPNYYTRSFRKVNTGQF
jgi:hypothetical protein